MDFNDIKILLILQGWTKKYKMIVSTEEQIIEEKVFEIPQITQIIKEVYQKYNIKNFKIYLYGNNQIIIKPYIKQIIEQLKKDNIPYEKIFISLPNKRSF